MRSQPAILGETFTFRRINWKSFRVIYSGVLLALAAPVFLGLSLPLSIKAIFILYFIVFAFFGMRLYGMLTQITIGPDGIIYRTPFRIRQYDWNSLLSTGMLVQNRNVKQEIPVHKYDKPYYLREKLIFVTKYPIFPGGWFLFVNENYVDFHYREKAWELIQFYMSKKPAFPGNFSGSGRTEFGA